MCFQKIRVSLDVKSILSWAAALSHCCESLKSYSSCQPNHIKWSFWRIMEVLFRIACCGGHYNKNFYMRRIIISKKGPISFKVNRQQQNDQKYISLHSLPALIKITPHWFCKHNASGRSEVCTAITSMFHTFCTAVLSSYWFLSLWRGQEVKTSLNTLWALYMKVVQSNYEGMYHLQNI